MRNLYLLIITAFIISACSNNESLDFNNSEGVNFGVYVRKTTKAGIATIMTLKTDGFSVSAYNTGEETWSRVGNASKPNFFYNQKVDWDNTTTQWTYTPLKQWPSETDHISFFAYSPTTAAVQLSSNETAGAPTLTYTCPNQAKLQTDLVVSMLEDQTEEEAKKKGVPTVQFAFRHILSKIDFKVKMEHTLPGLQAVTVRSLKYNYGDESVKNTMIYTFNKDNTQRNIWKDIPVPTFHTDETELMDSPINLDVSQNLEQSKLNNESNSLMLIPQTIEGGSTYATIEYRVNLGTQARNYIKVIDLPRIELLPGKSYTYNLVIGVSTIKIHQITTDSWAEE